jgi:hypothetical protein
VAALPVSEIADTVSLTPPDVYTRVLPLLEEHAGSPVPLQPSLLRMSHVTAAALVETAMPATRRAAAMVVRSVKVFIVVDTH